MKLEIGRRHFLGLAAGMLGASLPPWMATGFAQEGAASPSGDSDPEARNLERVSAAWRAARANGRPLLAILVPEDASKRRQLGRAWGVYLNSAETGALMDLALCEVVCAELDVLRRALPRLPDMPKPSDDGAAPLAILIETDEARAQCIELALEPVPFPGFDRASFEESIEIHERAVREQSAEIARVLRETIVPDRARLRRRAAQAAEASQGDIAPRPWNRSQLERYAADLPALVRLEVETGTIDPTWLERLATLTAERLRLAPPSGARWARSTGCGTRVEGATDNGLRVACGMAHIPDISQRFLLFYTDPAAGLSEHPK